MTIIGTLPFTEDYMFDRMYARDKTCDGLFLTGVVSTGIYCLPSCSARNPLAKNVRFFANEDEARAAGLRPCRRCRPDDFYQNYDPDRCALASLAAAIRLQPGDFRGVSDMAAVSGIGTTKLHALFRRYYDITPANFLRRERMATACRLLSDQPMRITDIAFEVGYESISAFQDNFRKSFECDQNAWEPSGKVASRRYERGGLPSRKVSVHGFWSYSNRLDFARASTGNWGETAIKYDTR